jgi:two-component system, NtrC family, sensor histidine kinase PilS
LIGGPGDTERRVGERRARRATSADESWFDTAGALQPSAVPSDWADVGAEVRRAEETLRTEAAPEVDRESGDSTLLSQPVGEKDNGETSAFTRLYRTFLGARVVLGVALAATLALVTMFGARPSPSVVLLSALYAALAISMWLLPRPWRRAAPQTLNGLRRPQWLATIGADLICFMLLHLLSPGIGVNYVALLVMPMLMAGVLTPRSLALATVAAVTLILLVSAWFAALAGGDMAALMTQAGLAGSGLFALTVLSNELAGRLAREERSSRGSLELARQQAQLNRLVIEEMQDGVLVVDRSGRVRAANPAARRLLAAQGLHHAAPFQLRGVPAWLGLVGMVERAFVDAAWPEAGRDVVMEFGPAASRTLHVRIRFTRRPEARVGEDLCVLFLEDVRTMQARSRQEKLAAMGRVSAGVAHEIRNPLAAIAQANALMAEDARDAGQRQLMQIVTDNVARLKRIVDDVMAVAPGQSQEAQAIDATAQVAAICSEWLRTVGLGEHGSEVLALHLPEQTLAVMFDPEHLRRVLVNLLDNALRHASGKAGAIAVRLDSRDVTRVFLSVASDGPPIPADVERYLFEPFFSSRSRGTGLGLYICRELCERHGASIDYRLRRAPPADRNEFFVALRRAPLVASETTRPMALT